MWWSKGDILEGSNQNIIWNVFKTSEPDDIPFAGPRIFDLLDNL